MNTDSPVPSDSPSCISMLEEAGVKLRRGKSGSVLLADFTDATLISLEQFHLLAELPRLRELDLSGYPIDDEFGKSLQQLLRIQTLNLSRTQVGDATLDHLAKLPKLKLLELTGSQVTLDRVRLLRKSMIGTRIILLD